MADLTTTVAPVANLTQNQTTKTIAQQKDMGKDAFLLLLTTQLTNQDPLNPMDNQQMIAQLAQFSQLEQLTNMNTSMTSMKDAQMQNTSAQLVGYIGKSIEAQGDTFSVSGGISSPIKFSLPSASVKTAVSVIDKTGNIISSRDVGPLASGEHTVVWDGKDINGNSAADGSYTYMITAKDAKDNPIQSTNYAAGLVTGVNYTDGINYLLVNGAQIPLSDVKTVRQ